MKNILEFHIRTKTDVRSVLARKTRFVSMEFALVSLANMCVRQVWGFQMSEKFTFEDLSKMANRISSGEFDQIMELESTQNKICNEKAVSQYMNDHTNTCVKCGGLFNFHALEWTKEGFVCQRCLKNEDDNMAVMA